MQCLPVLMFLDLSIDQSIMKIMKTSKTFKFRLKLKPWMERKFSQWSGCCRFVYNKFLDQRVKTYNESKQPLSYVDQANELPKLKKEFEWLKWPPSQSLQQTLKDLDQGFKNFFRRVKNGTEKPGFPKFKRKGYSDSFRLPQIKKDAIWSDGRKGTVHLPKIGKIKFIKTRKIEGRIRNVTIINNAGKWYICFNCEVDIIVPENNGSAIGVDRGVSHTIATSEGKFFDIPKNSILYWEGRNIQAQKKLARQKKGSNNRSKQKARIRKINHKIFNIRKDFLHKVSTGIAKNHSCVVLEKLKTKNMTKSAKGSIESPGKNVKAKSGLNKAILMQGWYKFEQFLAYKVKWLGSCLKYVKPHYTSQRCSNSRCNHVSPKNRKTQETFKCVKCGYAENADVNAAKNIFTDGLLGRACGDAALVGL